MFTSMPDWAEEIEDDTNEAIASDVSWISEDSKLDEFSLNMISASMEQNNVVEGGFFSSLILAPFKALFWGVTFLIKLVGLIALVIGLAVASPLIVVGFGAFIWYLTNKVRNKFRNWKSAAAADPEKAEQAREFAPRIAQSLTNPKVQQALKDDPKAAEAIYGALDSLGQKHVTACVMAKVAASEIASTTDDVVLAAWQEKLNSNVVDSAVTITSLVLGGATGLIIYLTWFITGLFLRKWRNGHEASRVNYAKAKGAREAAKKVSEKMDDPRVKRMLAKNPEAAKLLHEAIEGLK